MPTTQEAIHESSYRTRSPLRVFIGLLLVMSIHGADQDALAVMAAPEGADLNADYTVMIRSPGSEWRPVDVYGVRVNLDDLARASFALFDFSGRVEVSVVCNRGRVDAVRVRPGRGVSGLQRTGDTTVFLLDQPGTVSFEVNGDILHNLHLCAGRLETAIPSPAAPGVMWFGPGIHRLGNDPRIVETGTIGGRSKAEIRVSSGTHVHLAAGAVVEAAITLEKGSEDIVISGRGVIDLSGWNEPRGKFIKDSTWQRPAIAVWNCRRVRIEGITIKQPTGYSISGGQSSEVVIDGINSFSSHEWSDGIDMMSCSQVTIRNVFLRNSDDNIAVYGSRFSFRGGSRDWSVLDSVFWADKAHAIHIGIHGDYEAEGDVIEDLVFRDIDILEDNEIPERNWGCITIACGDKNVCRDMRFEDIRIDHLRDDGQRLIDLRFKCYRPSVIAGRSISGIVFSNITYDGPHGSLIAGASMEQQASGILFEGCRINGRIVSSADDAGLVIGPFVTDIRFAPAGR